jgi:hypothetical protein
MKQVRHALVAAPVLPYAPETLPHSISISAMWRDALSTFSAHSAAILLCAFIGFAAPTIISAGISTSATLSAYAQTRSVTVLSGRPIVADDLASPGIPEYFRQAQRDLVRQLQTAWLVQMVAGLLGLTFARGAITWMALHGSQPGEQSETCGSFGEAIRMALTRYPALLAGTLFYGAIITACIVGMSDLTQPLEFVPGKTARIWVGLSRSFDDTVHQLLWRGFNDLIPNPGSPFAEFSSDLRRAAFRYLTSTAALISIVFIVVVETLLRFRTIAALKPVPCMRSHRFGMFAPLVDSARFGLKHFFAVTVHIWLLRLAIFGLSLCLIEFPMALMDNFVAPNVMRPGGAFPIGGFEILPTMRFIAVAGAAPVSAIMLAFCVVYDTRLYAALRRACEQE